MGCSEKTGLKGTKNQDERKTRIKLKWIPIIFSLRSLRLSGELLRQSRRGRGAMVFKSWL